MDDKELRNRIQKLDPMSSGVETRSVQDESSRQMLEAIMEKPISGTDNQSGRRMQWFLAAAAVAAVALGSFAIFGGGAPESPPLQLALGDSNSISSCIIVSADILRDMPVAFEGTATSVEGETVTLSVDDWFTAGDATTVELAAPAGLQALIGGIDFEVGSQYLIAATDGTVNYCGYSDLATPELRAIYDEAFPG